ncbi:MAG: C-terminal helicase domain-containing protein, partial [Eubacteriales bacterium]
MGGYGGYEVIGYKHQDELMEKAHSIAYRVTLDECYDMTQPVDQILKVELSKDEQTIYDQMENEFLVEFGDKMALAPIVLTQLLRLQQITGGFLPDEEGTIHNIGRVKLDALKEFVSDLPNTQKMVIFCRFIPEIKAISEVMTKIGRKSVLLYGAVKNREQIIKQFREDPDTTVFIAQIQTGGLGIDLASADMEIFFSTNFSYTDFDQARKRVLGPKQKHPVTYVHIVADGTVDEDVLAILRSKGDVAHTILDTMRARLAKADINRPFTNPSTSDIVDTNSPKGGGKLIALDSKESGWHWDETTGKVIRRDSDKQTYSIGKVSTLEEAK